MAYSKDKSYQKARTLREVREVAELGPLPANDPRYVDLTKARGAWGRKRLLRLLDTDRHVYIAYAGHRGSGKTTELNRLQEELRKQQPSYYIIYRDAYPDLAITDLDYTDLLLYVAQAIFSQVAEEIPLSQALFQPIEDWFLEVTQLKKEAIQHELQLSTRAEVGAKIPFLGGILSVLLSRIKGYSQDVKEIRAHLRRHPEDLLEKINSLLGFLVEELKKHGKPHKLLLIIDSLDRLPPEVLEGAFVKMAHLFTRLQTSLLLTVPLGLIYLPHKDAISDTDFHPLVLPLPRVRRRNQTWKEYDKECVSLLEEVIERRVEVEKVFAEPSLVRQMALMSGGDLRELLRFLFEASLEAEDKIDREILERAFKNEKRSFLAHLKSEDLPRLLKIHQTKELDKTKEEFRLLFYRFALEYNDETWYDIHPLIYYYHEPFRRRLEETV